MLSTFFRAAFLPTHARRPPPHPRPLPRYARSHFCCPSLLLHPASTLLAASSFSCLQIFLISRINKTPLNQLEKNHPVVGLIYLGHLHTPSCFCILLAHI